MRLCHYGFQKKHSLLTLLCIYSTIFVIFTFPFFIINHLQLHFVWIMEERNVKILPTPGSHLSKLNFKILKISL